MDVVREEQAAFREEMDSVKSKIEQIFEAIQALARREEEARVAAAARNDALVQGVALQSGSSVPIPNPVIYGLPSGFVPPPERTHVPPPAHTSGVADGVAAQGPPIVNQVVIPRTNEELQDEFEMQNYNGATPVVIPTAAQDSEAILMCRALAKKLRILEGHNSTRLSALEMCLVPNVVIPPKFKAPEFEKYKGLTCPNIHLKMYCRKMAAYARDDKLVIHCFKDSLTGASLDWYMQLECSNIHTWDELVEAFANQYKYNTDMAQNRTQLQSMAQKDNESFKEYAQRWRELAARVHPPLVDRELIDIFMGTLQGQYYERLISSVSTGFSDMVIVGERVEEGLKSGKI
ncbi:uncharacterized protein LOC127094247 [Lathyrus oleraceus]|uniref:uncharacterized protein LOC127094247 n=1 Tax=Pisum sativum TaxID=3888 RepID=UPI0021CE44A3|nr:uncharacterized protein LOC127094247 [Pisum sativum]